MLAKTYDYVGIEPDVTSFETARRRISKGRVLNISLEQLQNSEHDLVIALEVLEHIADDLEALRLWVRHVRPGGQILLSVPAD